MSKQANPLDDFNFLQSGVTDITHKDKPKEQQMPEESNVTKSAWQHFTVICGVEIVDKVKAISHKEGFSIREVVEKYLKDGIARYEQKHGAVTKQRRNIDDIL